MFSSHLVKASKLPAEQDASTGTKAQMLRACAKAISHPHLEAATAVLSLVKEAVSLKLCINQFESLGPDSTTRIARDTKQCKLLESLAHLGNTKDMLNQALTALTDLPEPEPDSDTGYDVKSLNASACMSNVEEGLLLDAVNLLCAKQCEEMKACALKLKSSPGVENWLETDWRVDEEGQQAGTDLKSALAAFESTVGKVKVKALSDSCEEMEKAGQGRAVARASKGPGVRGG